ncbi:PQQ-binding-like beta-propeller repeat protein [Leekyejoonella antrihumi]|nr:PQQ-binding-like beta-propeller repeat protein [Leekyejoonella antrihumi]
MTRRGALAALTVCCGGLLAGCGPSGSASSGADSSPPSVSAAHSPSARPAPASTTPGTAGGQTGSEADWPAYHRDRARTGAVADGPALDPPRRAWTTSLGAAVRGQPVVAGGRIIAATERNRVVALDPATGRVLWSRALGAPLTDVAQVVGCGNIDPLGITSTPVIDTVHGIVYVVAEIGSGGTVHHQLVGFDVRTGRQRSSTRVDPPLPAGESSTTLLQRAGLAFSGGRVYVAYTGNFGDCGRYHGWVVGVDPTGARPQVSFEVAPDGEGGAIWQSGGAPAVDAAGNLYVSTGNANPDPPQGGPDPKKYTESVVRLSPDLRVLASFKDRVAGGDEDLSAGNPVLLPGGEVFAVGKTDVGYLLRSSDLHQIARIPNVCGSDPDGGPAFDRATGSLFVPCRGGGIQVIDVTHRRLGPLLQGADSAPIVVGQRLWALDHSTAELVGYAVKTGAVQARVGVGVSTPIFTSPSVGAGLLLVATTDGVVAFH